MADGGEGMEKGGGRNGKGEGGKGGDDKREKGEGVTRHIQQGRKVVHPSRLCLYH